MTLKALQVLLLLLSIGIVDANAQQTTIIRSLTDEWQVYNEEENTYVPYLPKYHASTSQLHLLLITTAIEPYYLTIESTGATHLFLNNQLLDVLNPSFGQGQSSKITFSIASLLALGQDSSQQLMLSLYGASTQPLSVSNTYISKYGTQVNVAKARQDYTALQPRVINYYQSTLVLLGVGLMAVFAVFYRIPNPIFNLSYLSRYLSGFTKAKSEGGRIDSISFILFGIFYGLVLAYFLTLNQSINIISPENTDRSFDILTAFGQMFLWLLIFLFIKFTIVWLTGILYDNRKAFNIHVQEFMNINQIFSLGLLVTTGALHFSNSLVYPHIQEIASTLLWVSLLISALLVSYRINKTLPFKKVYLFSYLCGTEFFPVLVLIKFLIEQ